MPIFCRKNVHSLRNTVLLCQLKKNHEKPPAVMPIFDQKTSILSKQHYIMSQRSQQDALFLRFLTKKLSLLCPYFVKKRPFSKKHTALKSIFCQKNVHSLKNTVFLCHFFKIFMKNPLAVKTIFGQKTSILQGCSFTKFW